MFEIRPWAIEGETIRDRSVPFPTPVSTGSGSKGSSLCLRRKTSQTHARSPLRKVARQS